MTQTRHDAHDAFERALAVLEEAGLVSPSHSEEYSEYYEVAA